MSALRLIGIEQLVQMHDHIFHFGIVYRALGIGPPSLYGAGIIGKNTDQIDRFQIGKFERLRVGHATAHYKMKFLHI